MRLGSMLLALLGGSVGMAWALANLAFDNQDAVSLAWLAALGLGLLGAIVVTSSPRAMAWLGLIAGGASLAVEPAFGIAAGVAAGTLLAAAALAYLDRSPGPVRALQPAPLKKTKQATPTAPLDRLERFIQLGDKTRTRASVRVTNRPRLS